jgi:hypothetical protein
MLLLTEQHLQLESRRDERQMMRRHEMWFPGYTAIQSRKRYMYPMTSTQISHWSTCLVVMITFFFRQKF